MRHKNTEYFSRLEQFIDSYRGQYGTSPTIQTIAKGTGLSASTVCRYMQHMREHGMLDYEGHRNIRTKKFQYDLEGFNPVPLLGEVACGVPAFAEENIEAYVRLPVALFGNGDFYLLRAKGESMVEAGIDEGDLVLIRKQDTAEPGEIVVALMEEEATLTRYYPEPENHRIRLHPENSSMEDIYVETCMIQGTAVKVLKDLV